MSLYWISIGMVILANLTYHLFQKSISQSIHPLFSLMITYVVALVVTGVLYVTTQPIDFRQGVQKDWAQANWASFALGISIILLEAGFLFAYRAGWKLSIAGLFANVAVGLLLLPIGLILFREELSLLNRVGVALALVGLIMMGIKTQDA